MPSAIENLITDLYAKKFPEVIQAIQTNTDLVNGVNPSNECSLFMEVIQLPPINFNLITTIVSNPQFNLHFRNPKSKETNIDVLISTANPELLKFVSEKTNIVFNGDKLSYTTAKEQLQKSKNHLTTITRPTGIERQKARIAKVEQIIEILRDLTINHAIDTGNTDLLNQLKSESSNTAPTQKSSNGILSFFKRSMTPAQPVTPTQPRPQASAPPAPTNALAEWGRLEAEQKRILAECEAKNAAVLAKAGKEREQRMARAAKAF